MQSRIHIVIDEREREAFKASAAASGVSLSEWLRGAARVRLRSERPTAISSTADLDRFFAEQADVENGTEPDWDDHLLVIGHSRRSGLEPA